MRRRFGGGRDVEIFHRYGGWRPPLVRLRALRPGAAGDAEAGHPFLTALHRARAAREARTLNATWGAYDQVLAQPALRATLERKYAVTDDAALKQAMLVDALAGKPFLKAWLERSHSEVTPANLQSLLIEAAKLPAP